MEVGKGPSRLCLVLLFFLVINCCTHLAIGANRGKKLLTTPKFTLSRKKSAKPFLDGSMKEAEDLFQPRYTFAYYVTGHGYGHATRVVEVCRQALGKGHKVIVCTCAPAFIFTRELEGIQVREVEPLDIGGHQIDALRVDPEETLRLYYEKIHSRHAELVAKEAEWLSQQKIDMVLTDSVPLACAAAKAAGRPSVAITNLMWSHIYRDYLPCVRPENRSKYRDVVDKCLEDYQSATAILRLPGADSMKHFQRVIDVPLVVRMAKKEPALVRHELGVPKDAKVVLITFGGQQTDNWKLSDSYLPPGWIGLVTRGLCPDGRPPSRYKLVAKDCYLPDVINAADVVIGKIGYGTTSEILAHNTPFIFVPREHWNEQQYLLTLMQEHGTPIRMCSEDFYGGRWHKYLESAYALRRNQNRRYRGSVWGASTVVTELEKLMKEQKELHRKGLNPSPGA